MSVRVHWLSRLLLPLPGVEGLARHLPELRSAPGQILLPVVWQLWLAAGVGLCLVVDPRGFVPAMILQAALVGGAFLLVDVIGIHGRERWLRISPRGAYRVCFWGLFSPGLMMGFLPGTVHLALVPGARVVPLAVSLVVGGPILLLGLLIAVRVYLVFGLDRFLYLYMFHPERGELADDEIFRHLRHPQYASFLFLFAGLVVLHGSVESGWLGLPFVAFAVGRILPEERELVARFGDSYRDYRRRTPALVPGLRGWAPLLRYLLTSPIRIRRYDGERGGG